MLKGKRFICDLCNELIKTKEFVEVCKVDGNCCNTGETALYFHLYTDKSSKHSEYYGGKGCYKEWVDSDKSFIPHGVRKVDRQEVLKSADK